MISRKDKNKTFRLTRNHFIPNLYNLHILILKKDVIYKNIIYVQENLNEYQFRKSYLKLFFETYNDTSEVKCYNYIKIKFENKININEDIIKEIAKANISNILNNRDK